MRTPPIMTLTPPLSILGTPLLSTFLPLFLSPFFFSPSITLFHPSLILFYPSIYFTLSFLAPDMIVTRSLPIASIYRVKRLTSTCVQMRSVTAEVWSLFRVHKYNYVCNIHCMLSHMHPFVYVCTAVCTVCIYMYVNVCRLKNYDSTIRHGT